MEYKGPLDIGHLLNSEWLESQVRETTGDYANQLRATLPKRTGRLASSVSVSVNKRGGAKRDRAVGTVTVSVRDERGYDYAAAAEFGNSRSRGAHAMRRLAT